MIPLIVAGLAGAAVGAVANSALSDDKPREIHHYHEGVSEDDVPDDVKAQVEGYVAAEMSPQELYQAGNDYCYGWNGCPIDKDKAYDFYTRAANAGHRGAQVQIRNLFGRR